MIGKAYMGFLGAVGLMVAAGGPAAAQGYPPAAPVVVAQAGAQPAMSDVNITADIKARMEQNVLLRRAQLTIATTNGVVTLSGMVPSQTAKEQAVEAAKATPGVVRVDDMLRLDVSSPQAPSQN
jgi:hyperosmotically inducible protein